MVIVWNEEHSATKTVSSSGAMVKKNPSGKI